MPHYSENPIVKETAASTLYELVNSMVFLVDAMPSMVEENQNDDTLLVITPQKFNGFKNNLDVIRAATETAYTQCKHEQSIQGPATTEPDELNVCTQQ